MIEKISKLLAQAEGASTEEEAEAYFAAAQRLSTQYSIDLAVARSHIAKSQKRETPERRTFVLGEMASRNTKKFLVELFIAIAHQNDVKCDITHDSTIVYPYGFPSDLDVVEAMFAAIAPQMIRAGDEYIRSGDFKQETTRKQVYNRELYQYEWVEKPIHGKVARSNFYKAYATKIRERLEEAKTEVIAEAVETNGTGTELVLADKSREVRDFHKANSKARGSWKRASTSGWSGRSQSAGAQAGASARLSQTKGVSGGRVAINA